MEENGIQANDALLRIAKDSNQNRENISYIDCEHPTEVIRQTSRFIDDHFLFVGAMIAREIAHADTVTL